MAWGGSRRPQTDQRGWLQPAWRSSTPCTAGRRFRLYPRSTIDGRRPRLRGGDRRDDPAGQDYETLRRDVRTKPHEDDLRLAWGPPVRDSGGRAAVVPCKASDVTLSAQAEEETRRARRHPIRGRRVEARVAHGSRRDRRCILAWARRACITDHATSRARDEPIRDSDRLARSGRRAVAITSWSDCGRAASWVPGSPAERAQPRPSQASASQKRGGARRCHRGRASSRRRTPALPVAFEIAGVAWL